MPASNPASTVRITIEFVVAEEPSTPTPTVEAPVTPAAELSLDELLALENKFDYEIAKSALWGMELAIVELRGALYTESRRQLADQLNEERRQLQFFIHPNTWDAAAVAKILRRMAKLEMALFRSGLSKMQLGYMTDLRNNRGCFWYMIPEGT